MNIDEIRPTESPRRVFVSKDGTAVPPDQALRDYGLKPDIVFVREDGWTLGAPEHLQEEAFAFWEGELIAFYRLDDRRVLPIRAFI